MSNELCDIKVVLTIKKGVWLSGSVVKGPRRRRTRVKRKAAIIGNPLPNQAAKAHIKIVLPSR